VNLAIHENPAFWVLWLVTLVICVHQMVRAIQTPIGILGFVPVICAMFGYLFVIQAAAVATTMSHRIDPDYLAMGELVALTCLLAILAGWHKGAGKVVMPKTERPIQVAQGRMLWYCGISAICVGIFGQYYYFIMVLPEREVVVAYVYMVFHVAFPGLAICVYLASADRAFRTGGNILALLILGSIFIWPWIYAVRRAPTFTFLIILVYGFYLARPRKVNRMMVLTGLFSACVLMLFFFFIRDYSQSWGGSLRFPTSYLTKRTRKATTSFFTVAPLWEHATNWTAINGEPATCRCRSTGFRARGGRTSRGSPRDGSNRRRRTIFLKSQESCRRRDPPCPELASRSWISDGLRRCFGSV
jgi:hypothetical protein